jgi:hypothetical protein
MKTSRVSSNGLMIGVRWVARILALLMACFILFMAIGEGFNPAKLNGRELLLSAAFFVTWVGLWFGWRWEGLGGLLVVAGMAGFYGLDFALSGFRQLPRGPVFPMLALPGFLFLACWFWQRARPVEAAQHS